MRRQTNPITPHETWLKLFSSKLCIFCGLYSDFVLSPVLKDKASVGVLSSSIWVLYQGRIFLAATERKNITDLLCFEHAQDKICDAIFCRGNKSSFAPSLAFGAENIKNLSLTLRAREKIWSRLVGESNINRKRLLTFLNGAISHPRRPRGSQSGREKRRETSRCGGDEKVKLAIASQGKTTLHVHHAFFNISLPSTARLPVKMPNFTFCEGRKQAMTKFILFMNLDIKKSESVLAFDKVSELE